MRNSKLIIFLLVAMLFVACKQIKYQESETTKARKEYRLEGYVPTTIPEDVTKLYQEVTEGNNYNEDSVLLVCQGGPMPILLPKVGVEDHISSYNKKYRTYLVHQAQTYNPRLFFNKLSFDQITMESRTTVDMLNEVVQHFKQKGKKVYLWGASFGFFVIENYIANYGTEDISGAFLGNGRLDMNEVVWKGFSQGDPYMFDQSATIPISEEEEEDNMTEEISFEEDMDDVLEKFFPKGFR